MDILAPRVIVVCLEPRDLMVCPEKTVCQENLVEMERMVPRETLVCLVYLELLEERENQDWVELPDPRVTLDCRDQEGPKEKWVSWASLESLEDLDVMVSLVELDQRVIPEKMAYLEDPVSLDWQDLKETQVCLVYPVKMEILELMVYLEKMVSLVHLVCLVVKEKQETLDLADWTAYQVVRETLAMASQVPQVKRVTRDVMATLAVLAQADCLEKMDSLVLMEQRVMQDCQDYPDRREKVVCLDSRELKVNLEEMVFRDFRDPKETLVVQETNAKMEYQDGLEVKETLDCRDSPD